MAAWDAIVVGAGAAGMMAAIEAGKRGRRVLVLDHSQRIGRKILISGGGRCNFTNIGARAENYLSANPHFAKSVLARYTPRDFIALVEKHRIAYHEKTLGQLFCDGSAQQIVTLLEREAAEAGVTIQADTAVQEVQHGDSFTLRTNRGDFHASALVIATGGLSIPKIGATGFGYDIARQFGLRVRDLRPGLVPLVFNPDDTKRWCDLTGLSTEVVAYAGKRSFREKLLITHRGISGPAVLQISSYWQPGSALRFDIAPGKKVLEALQASPSGRETTALRQALYAALPQRFADRWITTHPQQKWSNAALEASEQALHQWEIIPAGTEGYEKAEVTAGGVDTDDLDAKTMQARNVPGLFFIGEVVDVTGWLGGYNFQWAWASGAAAGRAL
ncbi:aminoacetone oxidase family FAD-binding enzyme [Terriglobus albidus]|uniref:Aminoacetone oxidase family FAD-binding enzyme n=1 Tax=Terriglobus albidus TaxID=1592106 RepID=A0A5B9EL24_9BACT|nr:aminoacetone oxidase family FAD-binding enzyme [Terriglobus albidus]QEE31127.1 aminoacetone oxidase family FAD-binding enzyme [Terriglobus albidus]